MLFKFLKYAYSFLYHEFLEFHEFFAAHCDLLYTYLIRFFCYDRY